MGTVDRYINAQTTASTAFRTKNRKTEKYTTEPQRSVEIQHGPNERVILCWQPLYLPQNTIIVCKENQVLRVGLG